MADHDEQHWDAVLGDLEARLTAAERGDLGALSGWTVPHPAGALVSSERGAGILARQEALLARLREEQSRTAAAILALRRTQRRPAAAPPAYVDRAL